MALIFQLALLLQTGHAITTARVASHRMSLQPLHLTCTFATSSVVEREVLLMGGSFMMHMFMTWSFHLGSITLQMQAIPSVMLSWCHSVVFHLWEWESSGLQCVMFMASFSMPCLISWTGPRIIRSSTI